MMKYILFFIVGIAFTSCFPTQQATMEEDIIALENTKWELIKPTNLKGTIEFNEDTTGVSGNNGCNNYGASLTKKNYQLEFGAFMTTRMYCEDANDEEFMKLLARVDNYLLTNKSLQLKGDGVTLLTFKQITE